MLPHQPYKNLISWLIKLSVNPQFLNAFDNRDAIFFIHSDEIGLKNNFNLPIRHINRWEQMNILSGYIIETK